MNFEILSTICTECGEKTSSHYSKSGEWWDKYLKDGESVCPACMLGRDGFEDEFKELIGFEVGDVFNG